MKERIIQFLSTNNLTSTRFADKIGVQRSSISHLLSGRNKPSFDFIEKMLNAYPEVNAQWLITGKGNMYISQPSLFAQEADDHEKSLTSRESNIQNLSDNHPEKELSAKENKIENSTPTNYPLKDTDIERVIIFYQDGSFNEYKPG